MSKIQNKRPDPLVFNNLTTLLIQGYWPLYSLASLLDKEPRKISFKTTVHLLLASASLIIGSANKFLNDKWENAASSLVLQFLVLVPCFLDLFANPYINVSGAPNKNNNLCALCGSPHALRCAGFENTPQSTNHATPGLNTAATGRRR